MVAFTSVFEASMCVNTRGGGFWRLDPAYIAKKKYTAMKENHTPSVLDDRDQYRDTTEVVDKSVLIVDGMASGRVNLLEVRTRMYRVLSTFAAGFHRGDEEPT